MDRGISIAPRARGDFGRWQPLWHGYLEFYGATLGAGIDELTFERLAGGHPQMGGALAADGAGRALGLVHWIAHPSTWTRGEQVYLQDLYVVPDARGGGLASRLIECVRDVARVRGGEGVYWLTHESNATARRLYDRVARRTGFIEYAHALD